MKYYLWLVNGFISTGCLYESVDENGNDNTPPFPDGAVECTLEVYNNPEGYTISNGVIIPPTDAELLLLAQTAQNNLLSQSCQTYLYAGFTSDALGSVYNYPSTATDQQNLASAAATDTTASLWCQPIGGVWAFVAHTADQVTKVSSDWLAYLNAAQARLISLNTQVNAATTTAAAEAITW
jgi:hypothetical protein